MCSTRVPDERGLSLLDVLMTVALMAVLATTIPQTLAPVFKELRVEQTKARLVRIRNALVGDSDLEINSSKADFGYLGDLGAIPTVAQGGLSALLSSPAGVTSYLMDTAIRFKRGWSGPYLPSTLGVDWTKDAWGNNLVYSPTSTPVTITSYGANGVSGGTGFDADLVVAIPSDQRTFKVHGLLRQPGGGAWSSSAQVEMNDLNGSGNVSTTLTTVAANGTFSFDPVTRGKRSFTVYLPVKAGASSTLGPYTVLPGLAHQPIVLEVSSSSDPASCSETPVLMQFSPTQSAIPEGELTDELNLDVTMSGTRIYNAEMTYDRITAVSTAQLGVDHNVDTGTITMTAGSTTTPIIYERIGNSDKTFNQPLVLQVALGVSNSSGVTLGQGAVHRQLIIEDDGSHETVAAIAQGTNHGCFITGGTGRLFCAGANTNGQVGNGTTTTNVITPYEVNVGTAYDPTLRSVAAGAAHTCAIRVGGGLFCWGARNNGRIGNGNPVSGNSTSPVQVGSPSTYSQVTAGEAHTCAIRSDGKLFCWGRNSEGQVGDASTSQRNSPVSVDGALAYQSVSAGQYFTCGVTTTNILKCWGNNTSYQLGDGTNSTRTSPVVIDSGVSYSLVAAGATHTCALTTAGVLKCWGANISRQLGDGTATTRTTPTVIDSGTTYSQIGLGSLTTCGVTTSEALKCWGQGANGAVGIDGTLGNQTLPVAVDSGSTYSFVAQGYANSTTCAVTADTAVMKCWGSNFYGQFFDSTQWSIPTPTPIHDPSDTYQGVFAGTAFSCGVTSSGLLKCWGYNNNGKLGIGFTSAQHLVRTVPGRIGDPCKLFTKLNAGTEHGCGITTSGELRCWGLNTNRQLADGTTTARTKPVASDSAFSYSEVSAGGTHTCGITTANALRCWGNNSNGQLGQNNTTTQLTAVNVDSAATYQKVSAGANHTCGITSAGVLKCWGLNSNSRLGDGTTTQRNAPVIIDSGTSYSWVSAGDAHSCGITTTGVLKCWGAGSNGRLGTGGTGNQTTPAVIDSGVTYSRVSAGGQHGCGVTTAGVLKCWGLNTSYQVGDGTITQRNSPVVVDSGTTYSFVSAGSVHSCGLTTTGVVKCWGEDRYGQGGSGVYPRHLPSPIW